MTTQQRHKAFPEHWQLIRHMAAPNTYKFNKRRFSMHLNVSKLFIGTLLLIFLRHAVAGEAAAGPLSESSYLTGDWGGARSRLAEQGVGLEMEYTALYQGLVSGDGDKTFEYGGKADVFLNLDSGKLGLWQGGGLRAHVEYRHGDAKPFTGGALLPVNSAVLTPIGADEEATSLFLTQVFGKTNVLMVGKIDAFDLLAADPFFGGWGTQRMMNTAFVAPPNGIIPAVMMGAVASFATQPVALTVMVFDPNDRSTSYFPDDLFSDGTSASLSVTYPTTLAGRKTSYTLSGSYSSKDGADFSTLPPGIETTTKDGSYSVEFQFGHNLQEDSNNADAWGVFLKVATTGGNPNPIDYSVIGGIGGKPLFFNRPQDSFGIGYFYYAFDDDLRDVLNPLVDFHNEEGLEIFYSYAVTPWLHVTPDLQYIDPASGGNNNAFVAALRANIRF
jgi:porin